MKLCEKLCVLLSAAVLLQLLAGCGAADPAEVSSSRDVPVRPSQGQKAGGPSAVPDSSEELPAEPAPEAGLWDPEHTLDIPFTPSEGLELPVTGATGYASVKLPLWEQLPEGSRGKLSTVYAAPQPVPEPEPTESPAAPDPEPAPETPPPAPEESDGEAAPPQDDAPAPGGDEDGPEPVQSAGEDPVPPESGGDPSAEPVAEPTEEPPSQPVPEPTPPEPTPEPTSAPDPLAGALLVLEPGAAFVILEESGDWWQVRAQGATGWVEHRYCLINLPDVIPSIIYNDTNSYASVFTSSGKDIPNITGKALYQSKAQNDRLGRREFMMPVLYTMAKNVCQAQQNALAEGNTLVLYEGFWPYEAQTAVARGLAALSDRDEEVRAGVSAWPWNLSWFVATGASSYQEGYAIDVSLAKVTKSHMGRIGGCSVVQVDEYREYAMPTPIHELSMAAAVYTQPVAIFSTTAWRSAAMTESMAANEPAQALQRYCTAARLTPLASEWWHFNDLAAYSQVRAYPGKGNYEITQCLSVEP